jgi:hypothetical protein
MTHIDIVDRLDNIIELIGYLRCDATAVSDKFNIMRDKIHEIIRSLPLLPIHSSPY